MFPLIGHNFFPPPVPFLGSRVGCTFSGDLPKTAYISRFKASTSVYHDWLQVVASLLLESPNNEESYVEWYLSPVSHDVWTTEDSGGDGGFGRPRASQHSTGRRDSTREAGLLQGGQALRRRGKAPDFVHGAGRQDSSHEYPHQHAQACLDCSLIMSTFCSCYGYLYYEINGGFYSLPLRLPFFGRGGFCAWFLGQHFYGRYQSDVRKFRAYYDIVCTGVPYSIRNPGVWRVNTPVYPLFSFGHVQWILIAQFRVMGGKSFRFIPPFFKLWEISWKSAPYPAARLSSLLTS